MFSLQKYRLYSLVSFKVETIRFYSDLYKPRNRSNLDDKSFETRNVTASKSKIGLNIPSKKLDNIFDPDDILESAANTTSDINQNLVKDKEIKSENPRINIGFKKLINIRDHEQLNLTNLSRFNDLQSLSKYIYEDVFPPETEEKVRRNKNVKKPKKIVVTSATVAKATSMARQMKSLQLVYSIYQRSLEIPLKDRINIFDTDSVKEFITSAWELDRDIEMVNKIVVDSVSFGVVFDQEIISLLNQILSQLDNIPLLKSQRDFLSKTLKKIKGI
ncbi:hypothetical protein BB559_006005 [Furculomyces boomerangus]|uniref:Mtf2-like C-terminal domain-containing protein n=1 Tax=Furculomyces boomerangus TaxID=61424 RepID=A0A2T9Y597_9FUNG|nr:hypothetical protein BB559_006645 [Furculomyces boomerangus]PVU87511.1 hypothetical protein BB559_006005 [Furculomyces boomerangus]